MNGQKSFRSDRNPDQEEYNFKMAHMEKEISLYKDKLNRFKTVGKPSPGNEFEIEEASGISQAGGQSTGSFHISNGANMGLYSESMLSSKNVDNSVEAFSSSAPKIKVSRKDIRRLTEEEILKRSSSKNF